MTVSNSPSRAADRVQQLAEQIELACLIEATARKPGNVHPGASFDRLHYDDFVTAARVAAPILARSGEIGVGRAVRDAVTATLEATGTNVNLGICLLLAPLAAVPAQKKLPAGIAGVLNRLSLEDAKCVYEAIRASQPGGLGEVPDQDVRDEPTQSLLDVMKLAADRDSIAAEYAKEFRLTYLSAVAWLKKFLHDFRQPSAEASRNEFDPPLADWEFATISVQLSLMMVQGDTLIRRKCGDLAYHESACRAEYVFKAGSLSTPEGRAALARFDEWLREDGHRRNPGTTADLIAAIWFIALREKMFLPPTKDDVLEQARRIRAAGANEADGAEIG